MKNLKDITLSIFAIIGFISILSSFNNQAQIQETNGTPESHVWEMHHTFEDNFAYMYNKKTGVVRKLNSYTPRVFSTTKNKTNVGYIVMNEVSAEE